MNKRTRMRTANPQRGIGLIEVMVAVLIFSLGLIGLAGLLVMATGANHTGYLRTQASYLAHNMADRMSANPAGVWAGAYNNNDYPLSVAQDCAAGCTPAQLAVHDQQVWSRQLDAFLPEPEASIACTGDDGAGFTPSAAQMVQRPPYAGTCTLTISWMEKRQADAESERVATRTPFVWRFQP